MGQVALIEELLCWVAQGVPDAVKPLLEADRGIGTSPALIRVQGQTRIEQRASGSTGAARWHLDSYGAGFQESCLAASNCPPILGAAL